jgi:hypothetical protein
MVFENVFPELALNFFLIFRSLRDLWPIYSIPLDIKPSAW